MITLEVDKVDAGTAEKFEIEPNSLKSWKLITNIPKDASFRSRDIAVGMKITGYIIPGYKDTAGDSTLKLQSGQEFLPLVQTLTVTSR